jgi:hypothetical protein
MPGSRPRTLACTLGLVAALAASGTFQGAPAQARPAAESTAKPFVFEFYYKVKWGSLDEFLALYKKNHYPILQRLQKMGHILSMSAASPVNHAGEEKRWDFRFTVVYRDAVTAHEEVSDALIKELFPDQATFRKEEQRRFELLIEHMDIAISLDDLKSWP